MGCGGDGWLYRMDLEALGVEGLRELCGCGRSEWGCSGVGVVNVVADGLCTLPRGWWWTGSRGFTGA